MMNPMAAPAQMGFAGAPMAGAPMAGAPMAGAPGMMGAPGKGNILHRAVLAGFLTSVAEKN